MSYLSRSPPHEPTCRQKEGKGKVRVIVRVRVMVKVRVMERSRVMVKSRVMIRVRLRVSDAVALAKTHLIPGATVADSDALVEEVGCWSGEGT